MKGLLIKDLKLMKNQRNFFLLIVGVAVMMAISLENSTLVIGYLPFTCSLFTLSSISYDEYENGSAFLFSMPFSRKAYAVEKYSFGLLIAIASLGLATGITAMAGAFQQSGSITETIQIALMTLPAILLALALMIPFQFKFGGEKGRIAALGTVGLILIVYSQIKQLAEAWHLNLTALFEQFSALGYPAFLAAALLFSTLLLALSCRISISILERKEF